MMATWLGTVGGVAVVAMVLAPVAMGLAPVVGQRRSPGAVRSPWMWPRWALLRLGRRRHRLAPGSDLADMVNVLESIGRALRSGAGVHGALRGSASLAGVHTPDLDGVVAQLDSGVPLVEALGAWRRRCPRPAVALATAVLTFGVHSGGSVARGVDAAAATLRERLALQGEVRVLAAQARSSAAVVALAPVAFTVVVAMADGRVAGFLFTTVGGLVCLVVGVALEVACVRWMRALTAAAGEL